MARKRSFDEQAVLRAARDVFWVRGYEASSLDLLQEAMGLSRSSLYETFGSKRALFARVLEGYLAEVIDPRLAPLDRPGAGFDSLITYFEDFGKFFRAAPAKLAGRGCLLLNTATELAVLDDDAAAMVENYRRRMAAVFLAALGQAVQDGDLEADEGATRRRAELLTAQVVGLFLTSRLSLPAAAGLATAIAAEIRSWRPSRRP
ncbi:MAG TPA: helix-turn-helix domain-containing protein [Kineosporiaceae bacterium]|nr:helix-turn-helix domain-containing protein [Kineosporiaceae bacterium]